MEANQAHIVRAPGKAAASNTALVDAALKERAAARACDMRSNTALVDAALKERAAARACDIRAQPALVDAALEERAAARACELPCRKPAVIREAISAHRSRAR